MLNMAKVYKKIWTYLCQIHTSGFLTSFVKFFRTSFALRDFMKGGTPYMGTHTSTGARALHSAALHWTRSGRMSLKCVFGCEGKITLFSFLKNPALREHWICF